MEQLYSSNTTVKYPLDPFHEADIPNDMLLDMSLSINTAEEIFLTNFVVTDNYLFFCLETIAGKSVGRLMLTKYRANSIYPLTMTMPGTGWVVFGPGVKNKQLRYTHGSLKLDPSVIVRKVPLEDNFKFFVNNQQILTDDILLELIGSGYISLSTTTHDGKPAIELKRNDLNITIDELRTIFEDIKTDDGKVLTIGGAAPDENGNVDIKLETPEMTGSILPVRRGTEILGFILLVQDIEECGAYTPESLILCGKQHSGLASLPLDFVNCPEDEVCEE